MRHLLGYVLLLVCSVYLVQGGQPNPPNIGKTSFKLEMNFTSWSGEGQVVLWNQEKEGKSLYNFTYNPPSDFTPYQTQALLYWQSKQSLWSWRKMNASSDESINCTRYPDVDSDGIVSFYFDNFTKYVGPCTGGGFAWKRGGLLDYDLLCVDETGTVPISFTVYENDKGEMWYKVTSFQVGPQDDNLFTPPRFCPV